MIYTYEITTGRVVMVSETPNEYTNPNWADLSTEDSYSTFIHAAEGKNYYVVDGAVAEQ